MEKWKKKKIERNRKEDKEAARLFNLSGGGHGKEGQRWWWLKAAEGRDTKRREREKENPKAVETDCSLTWRSLNV